MPSVGNRAMQLQQRKKGESARAYQAYLDYREMGIARSLRKLSEMYNNIDQYIEFCKHHSRDTAHTSPTDCPTQRLGTLENWSSQWGWQERIEEWQEHLRQEKEKADEQARLNERENRKILLEKMRKRIAGQMQFANLHDEQGIKAMNALTTAFKAYMDLSMKTYNDMPTERKDITSDDKPIAVNFITEVVPEDAVNDRLKALGLDNLVDEHTN